MIFGFGARRSGTFWLQRIITAHPEVAPVPSESFFFSHAIAPLMERFQDISFDAPSTGRIYAERELLLDAVRDFSDQIFRQFEQPGTTRISERTPWHVQHLELMGAIYPDAYYVHIVRDGRDAVRSLASMPWFEGSLEEAAAEWRSCVLAPRQCELPERYVEVRYEELLSDPGRQIPELYERLGLDTSPDAVGRAFAEAKVETNTDPLTRVGAGKWRETWSASQLATFMDTAADALHAYGYDAGEAGDPEPAEARRPGALRLLRRTR
jgi:Sulfotransferase family